MSAIEMNEQHAARPLAHYLKVLSSHRKKGKFLLAHLLTRTRLCTLFTMRRENYALRFFPSSLSRAIWIYPEVRRSHEPIFRAFLRPGDVVVDVGANIGTHTLEAAALVGPQGHVYSVEANPRIGSFLARNVRLNRFENVSVFDCVVGSSNGDATISNTRYDDMNSVAAADNEGVVVPQRTLDNLLAREARPVSLLKIDVEGYEKFVLEGAAVTLSRAKMLYMELSESHFVRFGYRTRDVFRLLTAAEFSHFYLIEEGGLTEVTDDFAPPHAVDFIAARQALA